MDHFLMNLNRHKMVGAIHTPMTGEHKLVGAISTPTIGKIATPDTKVSIGADTTSTQLQYALRYPTIGLNNVTCPTVHIGDVVLPAGCEPKKVLVNTGSIQQVNTGSIDTSAMGTKIGEISTPMTGEHKLIGAIKTPMTGEKKMVGAIPTVGALPLMMMFNEAIGAIATPTTGAIATPMTGAIATPTVGAVATPTGALPLIVMLI